VVKFVSPFDRGIDSQNRAVIIVAKIEIYSWREEFAKSVNLFMF